MKDRNSFSLYRNIAITSVCNFLIILSWIIFTLFQRGSLELEKKAIDPSGAIQIFIAFITTAIGISAAFLAFNSLKFSQNAEEGSLYLKMMERYSSKEMVTALRTLGKFKSENKQNLRAAIFQWKADHILDPAPEYAIKLEDARHKVKYFYRDLMQMNQANYLNDKLTKRILNAGGRYLFLNLVLQMEPYSNPLQFEGEFGNFSKIHQQLERELTLSIANKKPITKICLIPARYDATRYPGKLLSILDDGSKKKSVIMATYDRINSYNIFDNVAIVTNSVDIKKEIESNGGNVIYIQAEHNSGSDRIAEAVKDLDADIIINVQGDEPFVEKEPLIDLLNAINIDIDDTMAASLMRPMDNRKHVDSSDFVKVVCNKNNFALYFSRSVIPYQKNSTPEAIFYEHIGVYAFTRKALIDFSALKPTTLERIESVECLRFLENGIPLKMVETKFLILEIDTEEDRKYANKLLSEGKLVLI